jgi:protein-tyrosine phosphatase
VYSISGLWPGRLAIVPRPRGGDWLADEIEAWRGASIGVVVSALEQAEVETFDLAREADLSRERGIEFVSFPITDRGVPSSVEAFDGLVRRLDALLHSGKNVAVHCRQSIGRAGMLATGVLIRAGQSVEQAILAVSAARGLPMPETAQQRAWLEQFARKRDTMAMGGK